MRREFILTHNRKDNTFKVIVEERHWWRFFVEESIGKFLALTGHPCCGRGIGRVDFVNSVSHSLLDFSMKVGSKNRSVVSVFPVLLSTALQIDPEFTHHILKEEAAEAGEDYE